MLLVAQWNAALDALMRFGRADDLATLARMMNRDAALLGDAAQAFAEDLAFIRVPSLLRISAPRLRDVLASKEVERFVARLPALEGTVEALKAWVRPLCSLTVAGPDGFRAMQHLAELYGRIARFAEQAAVIREGLVTGFGNAVSTTTPKEPGHPQFDAERKRFDNDKKGGLSSLKGEAGKSDVAIKHAIKKKHPSGGDFRAAISIIRLAGDMHDPRNDVLHAGMRSKARSASTLRALFEKGVKDFKALGSMMNSKTPANQRYFLNLSSNALTRWPANQVETARKLGLGEPAELDGGLPELPPEADESSVTQMATSIAARAVAQGAAGAFVATDYALTVALVVALQRRGIRCFCAASHREVTELPPDGDAPVRRAVFRFVRFREYPTLA